MDDVTRGRIESFDSCAQWFVSEADHSKPKPLQFQPATSEATEEKEQRRQSAAVAATIYHHRRDERTKPALPNSNMSLGHGWNNNEI